MSRYRGWDLEDLRKRPSDKLGHGQAPKRRKSQEPILPSSGFTPINYSAQPFNSSEHRTSDDISQIGSSIKRSRSSVVAQYLGVHGEALSESSLNDHPILAPTDGNGRKLRVVHAADTLRDGTPPTKSKATNRRGKSGVKRNVSDGMRSTKPGSSARPGTSAKNQSNTVESEKEQTGMSRSNVDDDLVISEQTMAKLDVFRFRLQSPPAPNDSTGADRVYDLVSVVAPATSLDLIKAQGGLSCTLYDRSLQANSASSRRLLPSTPSKKTAEVFLASCKGFPRTIFGSASLANPRPCGDVERGLDERGASSTKGTALVQVAKINSDPKTPNPKAIPNFTVSSSPGRYPNQPSVITVSGMTPGIGKSQETSQPPDDWCNFSDHIDWDDLGDVGDIIQIRDGLKDNDLLGLYPDQPLPRLKEATLTPLSRLLKARGACYLPTPQNLDAPTQPMSSCVNSSSSEVGGNDARTTNLDFLNLDDEALLDLSDFDLTVQDTTTVDSPKFRASPASTVTLAHSDFRQHGENPISVFLPDKPQNYPLSTNESEKPIVRPPFPSRLRDRSPVIGLSAGMVLRTCFRIGEALNVGSDALRQNKNVVIELYAKVKSSSREVDGVRQDFVFSDLFHDRPPFLAGVYELWAGVELWDFDGSKFLEPSITTKLCRCIGTMKRENIKSPKLHVLNIWEASLDDIDYVRGIVCS